MIPIALGSFSDVMHRAKRLLLPALVYDNRFLCGYTRTGFETEVDIHNALRRNTTCSHEGIIGQPLAFEFLPYAILQHKRGTSSKPLVVLLAGDTGTGKTTFERTMRKTVLFTSAYENGITVINGGDYMNVTLVAQYRESIRHRVTDAILKCSHGLIVFDEVHYMAPGVLDHLDDLIGPNQPVHFLRPDGGVTPIDFSGAMVIMTSNGGASEIARQFSTAGISRTNISSEDRDKLVNAIKVPMQIQAPVLAVKSRIDHYVPFVPATVGDAWELVTKILQSYQCQTLYTVIWSEAVPALMVSRLPVSGSFLVNGLSGIEALMTRSIQMRVELVWTRTMPRHNVVISITVRSGDIAVSRLQEPTP